MSFPSLTIRELINELEEVVKLAGSDTIPVGGTTLDDPSVIYRITGIYDHTHQWVNLTLETPEEI